MFTQLADSLIQESLRPFRVNQRIKELRKTPRGALQVALLLGKRDANVEKTLLTAAKTLADATKDFGVVDHEIMSAIVLYAKMIIKGRWPEAEPYILKDLYGINSYIVDVIQGPWPEAEDMISQEAASAYKYAKYFLKKRFPKGEPAILQDPFYAMNYAKFVLQQRWPEAEKIIKNFSDFGHSWADYKDFFGIEDEE